MVRIAARVITGPMLEEQLAGSDSVQIEKGAVLTPSALDYLKAHEVSVVRDGDVPPAAAKGEKQNGPIAGEKRFRGIFVPNIVIFDADGNINFGEMERYIAWLIEAGIHGLYPNGSTGEFVRLSAEERREVVRIIANVNQGRVPILAGASEANVRDVLDVAEYYARLNVDAISLVPPYYYKISERSLFEYYAEVARNSPLDILLYNIPQFTQELTLDIMEELLPFERIFGTKDSSRDLPRIVNTINRLRPQRPDYVVLNGCEEILLPAIIMGADGGTIATAGIIPEVIAELYRCSIEGEIERARMLQYRILELINLMLMGANFPLGFKTGVAVRGFDVGPPRQVTSAEERELLSKLEAQITCLLDDMGYEVDGAGSCPVTSMPPIVN